MAELIGSRAFRDAAAAGALGTPIIVGVEGGFIVEAMFGIVCRQLSARNASGDESRRVFPNLNAAASFMKKAGIDRFAVDASGHAPAVPSERYTRQAERLRRVHAAVRPAEH